MRISEGEKVMTLAVTPHEEEQDETAEAEANAEAEAEVTESAPETTEEA